MRGYRVYKDIWGAAVGEELECIRKRDNPRDAYAIAVGTTVGHLPRKVSPTAVQRLFQILRLEKSQ